MFRIRIPQGTGIRTGSAEEAVLWDTTAWDIRSWALTT
jgi:hypothetical protein